MNFEAMDYAKLVEDATKYLPEDDIFRQLAQAVGKDLLQKMCYDEEDDGYPLCEGFTDFVEGAFWHIENNKVRALANKRGRAYVRTHSKLVGVDKSNNTMLGSALKYLSDNALDAFYRDFVTGTGNFLNKQIWKKKIAEAKAAAEAEAKTGAKVVADAKAGSKRKAPTVKEVARKRTTALLYPDIEDNSFKK